MDAAQVCDRKKREYKVPTPEEWRMRETTYDSPYPKDGHWMFALPSAGFSLSGEYEISPSVSLFRWVMDESKRADRPEFVESHVINVLIHDDSKEPKMGMATPEATKCPTCGKPL